MSRAYDQRIFRAGAWKNQLELTDDSSWRNDWSRYLKKPGTHPFKSGPAPSITESRSSPPRTPPTPLLRFRSLMEEVTMQRLQIELIFKIPFAIRPALNQVYHGL